MRRARPLPVLATDPAVSFRPRPDDVVVERRDEREEQYAVVQSAVGRNRVESNRQQAIQAARTVAVRRAVDLWYCDGPTYRLLEVYRPRLT